MHQGNREFVQDVIRRYVIEPQSSVLEIGALDVNGSVREYFPDEARRYIGVDVTPGPGVDIVCDAEATDFIGEPQFDVLVILSVFEHTPRWAEILEHNLQWVRQGGLVILSWGAEGNRHHDPEPWAPVLVSDFLRQLHRFPMHVIENYFECVRYAPDCAGCYDVVARKR